MDQTKVNDTVKNIKRGFSLQMNGVASASMREKGIGGYLNWGIGFPVLRDMAEKYGKDADLAIALWKENVRECKILATLVMPPSYMDSDMISVWMEQTATQEIAEYAAYNLYQFVDNASIYAFMWLSSNNEIEQVCGYNVLSCLFKRGAEPEDRDINEYIDQAITALSDDSLAVRHASLNSLNTFASLGDMQQKIVDAALKKVNLI